LARRRAPDYDDKRDALMAQAARIFAAQGYERTSMSQLAAACGVSKALLYHYSPSKEALLHEIIHGHLAGLVEAVETVPRGGEPRDRLRALVGALLDAYRDSDAEHKLQLEALAALPEARQEEIRALERRLVAVVSEAVRETNPDLPAARLKPAAMSLFGMLNWFYMWFREGGQMTRDEYAGMVTTIFLDGARALR
jgi:TetR/AcrR family transcriptional regulator